MNETEIAEREDASSPLVFGQGQVAWLAVAVVLGAAALVLSVVAVVMAGGDSPAAAPGGASGVSDSLSVSATDFAFDPADVTVAAGTEVPVELVNDGAVEHNWTVLSEEIASEADFDEGLVLAEVPTLAAGESGSGSVTLDAGTYQVICTIAGHFDAGMAGSVTVQ